MQDEQTDEPVEAAAEESEGAADASAEDTGADAEAAADDSASAEDADTADAVDVQASPGGAGETVLKQPEVPSDANDKIAAAQQHIDNLNMDAEREAAERAQKNT